MALSSKITGGSGVSLTVIVRALSLAVSPRSFLADQLKLDVALALGLGKSGSGVNLSSSLIKLERAIT